LIRNFKTIQPHLGAFDDGAGMFRKTNNLNGVPDGIGKMREPPIHCNRSLSTFARGDE
jgi:hypothetical protein